MNTIGTRLKQVREKMGETQVDMGSRLGVHASVISSWERDKNVPNASALINLATIYNVNLNWLLTGEGFKDEPAQNKKAENVKTIQMTSIEAIEKLADEKDIELVSKEDGHIEFRLLRESDTRYFSNILQAEEILEQLDVDEDFKDVFYSSFVDNYRKNYKKKLVKNNGVITNG